MARFPFSEFGIGPLVFVAIASCVALGCSSSSSPDTSPRDATAADVASSDAAAGLVGTSSVQSLNIVGGGAQLQVTDLTAPPTVVLRAQATYVDGTQAPVPASWSIDRIDIATIGAGDGTVTPAGGAYGTATVTASAFGLTATAPVSVTLLANVVLSGVSNGDQGALAAATKADPAISNFAYPYDQTVFPVGLLPPEVMWNGGLAGDVYLLHIVAPNYDLSLFTAADPPSRYTVPAALWNALATTAAGGSATVSLRRLSAGTAYVSANETWKIAKANLRGSIYYWSVAEGAIKKLDLTTGTANQVFDAGSALTLDTPAPLDSGAPSNPPWEDALSNHERCVACHTVSKNGLALGAVLSRSESSGPFGYVDLSASQVKAIGDYGVNGAFEALTPDGKYAVVNDNFMTLALANTSTGELLPSAFDGQQNLCDPAFSPDGTKFAIASSCGLSDPQAYPVQYSTSNLSLYDVSTSADASASLAPTFSNPRTLLRGGDPSLGQADAIAFPSFSPDSQWIFYQRGTSSRAKINFTQPYTHGQDDLYVTSTSAGSPQIPLDHANGAGVLGADNLHLNYAPTVNPIAEGGYVWIVFTSPRDYGNRTGTGRTAGSSAYPSDATYANNKQLWVAAVDANIQTTDPSHPAFWLPGQDVDSINMFGYWALAPCESTLVDGGAPSCTAGFECCSGFCRGGVCVEPPTGGCHQVGEVCTTTSDCCGAGTSSCVAGICQVLGIK